VLGQRQDGRHTHSQMVSTDIEEFGILDMLPHLGLLQVLDFVEVRGGKVSAQRTVVTGNNDTASAGRGTLIVTVQSLHTGLFIDVLECLAVLVLSNAADVDGRIVGQDVLCGCFSNCSGWGGRGDLVPEHHEQCSVQLHQR